jgi:NAD(P)-dependent dehydrogenase (short-subunit alcohol dehydrogenase family)
MDLQGKAALVTGAPPASGRRPRGDSRRRVPGWPSRTSTRPAPALWPTRSAGLALPGDAAQPDTMTMAVDIAEDTFGRLDVVLLNAGSRRASPAWRTSTSPATARSWA